MENELSEGRYWAVGAKNGCAQLHVFTRIYTLLHKVPDGSSPQRRRDAEGADVGECGWKVGRKWEKAGDKGSVNPPFPAKSRLGRRKWLISRICAA